MGKNSRNNCANETCQQKTKDKVTILVSGRINMLLKLIVKIKENKVKLKYVA